MALWSLCWRKGKRCFILPAAPAAAGAIGAEGAQRPRQSRRLRHGAGVVCTAPAPRRFCALGQKFAHFHLRHALKTVFAKDFLLFFFFMGYRGWKIRCQYWVNRTGDLAFNYSALLDAGPLLNGNCYIIANVD